MITTLHINHLMIATLPFSNVIRDIGHKVGIGAVGFFHDAIFVIAVFRTTQPERALLLIGFICCYQGSDCGINFTIAIQRRFEIIIIEAHTKRLQI